MTHKQVYEKYKEMIPFDETKTDLYFPCGLNTIRVRLNTGEEFVFSYNSNKSWVFETVDNFVKKMKGKRKCNG